ncbi:hypothetical protein ACFQ0B_04965 [Nonomuraea thailandensis]
MVRLDVLRAVRRVRLAAVHVVRRVRLDALRAVRWLRLSALRAVVMVRLGGGRRRAGLLGVERVLVEGVLVAWWHAEGRVAGGGLPAGLLLREGVVAGGWRLGRTAEGVLVGLR